MVDRQLRRRDITDPAVLAAFEEVPRHRFVPAARVREAYEDHPVPIGRGQTISQPYIVALMVQHLGCGRDSRVLDVGAGSGYQTAILARLAGHVYAVERIAELADRARDVLDDMGNQNVTFSTHDGSLGWPEHAPFDRIICGAAAPDVPAAWLDQLVDGGRIVAPVGGPHVQELVVVEKAGDDVRRRYVCGVRFVKLIGAEGFEDE